MSDTVTRPPVPRRPVAAAPRSASITRERENPSWPQASTGKPVPRREVVPDVAGEAQTSPAAVHLPTPEPGQRPETAYASPRQTFAVKLPSASQGQFYPELPDGVVEFYPLTAVEDKILAGLTEDNVTEIFDSILARVVISPIAPQDLIETDRYYLLLQLRAESLGQEYEFPTSCVFCKESFLYKASIPSQMQMIEGHATEEPFYATLPVSGKKVGFRFLRGTDIKAVEQLKKASHPEEKGDPAYALAEIRSIVTIDGKPLPDFETARQWYMNLSLKDVRAVQKAINEASSGISNVIKMRCPKCNKESVTRVPLSPLYFFD